MAQKKFKPKAGNPAKAAEELRSFKRRTEREERDRALAVQERREALAEGRWDVETHGMYKNAPREAAPQPFSFNVRNDGSSATTTYVPKTTLTPVSKVHSNFVPRTDLDDVIDPSTVVRTTKSGKPRAVIPKARMNKKKFGQITLAGIGVGAMVIMGFLVPSMNGAVSFPGMGGDGDTGLATDSEGNVVLVDRDGMPIDSDQAVDFGPGTETGATEGEVSDPIELDVSSDGSVSDDPADVPEANPEDAVEPASGE